MNAPTSYSFELPPDSSAPRMARALVRERVPSAPAIGDLLLCVSEVVTNAVLHGRSRPRLTMAIAGPSVRVEVYDADPTMPTRQSPTAETPTGRGLLLLDRLTSGWGAERAGSGKVVWFTIDLEEESA